MWCTCCRQDVRGIRPQGHPHVCCARCGQALTGDDTATAALSQDSLAQVATYGVDLTQSPVSRYPSFDDWKTEQTIRELQARFAPLERSGGLRGAPSSADRTARWHAHASHHAVRPGHAKQFRPGRRSSFVEGAMWCLCLLAFAAGATLLTRSFVIDRFELWGVSLPLALCGQFGLFVAVALQLERIWRSSRDAVRLLEHVDSKLRRLDRARSGRTLRAVEAQAFALAGRDAANRHLLAADFADRLERSARGSARSSA